MRSFFSIIIISLLSFNAIAQDITGTWKTIDDDSGEVKSHVKIYEDGGKYYGKILKVLDPAAPETPLCVACKGELKDTPIEGLRFINGLEKKGTEFKNGTILDPENGKEYDCKLWLDEDDSNKLKVRGYIAFFYRTQTWERL